MTSIHTFDTIAHGLIQEILDDQLDLWFFVITLEEEEIPVNTQNMLMLIQRVMVNKAIFMIIAVGYEDYITYVGQENSVAKHVEAFLNTLDLKNIISDGSAFFVPARWVDHMNTQYDRKKVKIIKV